MMPLGKDSLFILSPQGRDELCARAAALGWRAVGARRPGEAERRFLNSSSSMILYDIRGTEADESLLYRLAASVEAIGGALILLMDADMDAANVQEWFAKGATHILFDGFADRDLAATLASAVQATRRIWSANDVSGAEQHEGGGQDLLTGLANRSAALQWLERACNGGHVPPHCLLIGLSQFDTVNDAYGQLTGDTVLARLASRLHDMVRDRFGPDAIAARVGGTEFLIGLKVPSDSREQRAERALLMARDLVGDLSLPMQLGEQRVSVTVRCGVAEGQEGDDGPRLLRRAAAALAEARRSSTGHVLLRSTDRRGPGLDLDRLDADLRLALGRGEIHVVFQPQYDVARGHLTGVEALARWNHPRHGQIGAGLLFGAAERSDFLRPLSRHVQEEALRQAMAWPEALSALRLSINVTAADLAHADFVGDFLAMVRASGFPPERLTVELTESGLVENLGSAAELLGELRLAGISVALDDFGTGYSSLAYLKALHIDYLKIDSGLTRDIGGAARDRVIVRSILAMAKSLSLKVIAEGVETEEQLRLLAREGCDYYQGFLRSEPLDVGQLSALVLREQLMQNGL